MLLYHPAFDLNHASYRIMLLLKALSPEYVEPDKLRILDFFFLFPAEIHSIRQPDKRFKTAFQAYAHYEEMTNPSKVFYQIEPIFNSALSLLKSRGVVVNMEGSYADEFIGIDYSKVPDEIKTRIESATKENSDLVDFLAKMLSLYPLRGVDGLKDRTKLLPFKKMTASSRPHLMVKRLIVRANADTVYDQIFHEGVNIIRGNNSSGKSTILDFIFHVLGGEVTIWKSAAALCTEVFAEVDINGIVITLHRVRRDQPKTPLSIFMGPLVDALKHKTEGWKTHPYSPARENETFTTVLFRLLGFPEVKADNEGNITIHQALRLSYIDQISRTTSLMREEDWDSPMKRKVVADLLFGVYDNELYDLQIHLRLLEQELKDITEQIKYNSDLLDAVGDGLDAVKLLKRNEELLAELEKINLAIEEVAAQEKAVKNTADAELNKLRTKVLLEKEQLAKIDDYVEGVKLEMKDSQFFIQSLERKLRAIEESLATRKAFGSLPTCPLCNVEVKHIKGEVACEFSGKKIPGDFGLTSMVKMKEELSFQIKESTRLQIRREKHLEEILAEKSAIASDYEIDSRTYQQRVRSLKSARDNRLDGLYLEKGRLEAEFKYLRQLLEYVEVLRKSKVREGELKENIYQVKLKISSRQSQQHGRIQQSAQLIKNHAREILTKDLERQDEFQHINSIELSFEKNIYYLNGKLNFSASSNAILKNAIIFGILFSSCEDDEFRYPRFLLCDNIEDAGMEEARSKAFQRVICDKVVNAKHPFQVIYTTSMIEEKLDQPEYTIGEYYTKTNKTLKLPPDLQRAAIEASGDDGKELL